MAKTTSEAQNLNDILASARAVVAEHQRQLDLIEQQAAALHAKGTRDIPRVAAATPVTLADQVVTLLTAEARDAREVAAELGVPVGRVKPIMDRLRDAAKIHNIGSEVEPLWQHVIGDDCTPEALRAMVLRLISWRPFSHRELVIVTGARDNRISGELANLREDKTLRVANLGNGSKGRWQNVPKSVVLAPLGRANGKR